MSEPSLFVAWESGGEAADRGASGQGLVLYVNPELHRLRGLVDAARARLAELEAGFTVEKAQIGALKARLFSRLREHFQKRDRLRLVVSYRRKYLETLVRLGEEEAGKVEEEHREADARNEREYSETAAAMAERKELAPEEAGELGMLWRNLLPDRPPDRGPHFHLTPRLRAPNHAQNAAAQKRHRPHPAGRAGEICHATNARRPPPDDRRTRNRDAPLHALRTRPAMAARPTAAKNHRPEIARELREVRRLIVAPKRIKAPSARRWPRGVIHRRYMRVGERPFFPT